MITAIVRFPLPAEVDLAEAKSRFEQTAPRYTDVSGLLRKYYLFGNGSGGGVYLWKTRAEAEAMYTPEWSARIAAIYGADPRVEYFETPVIVDNVSGEIETGSA